MSRLQVRSARTPGRFGLRMFRQGRGRMLLPAHSSSVPWLSRTRTAQIPTTEQLALQLSRLLADHRPHNLPLLPLLCSPPWGAGTSGSTSGAHWGRVNQKVLLDSQAILPEPRGGAAASRSVLCPGLGRSSPVHHSVRGAGAAGAVAALPHLRGSRGMPQHAGRLPAGICVLSF